MPKMHELLSGFPARSDRGYLGWSSCFLIETDDGGRTLFDTGGYNERGTLPQRLQALDVPLEAVDAVVLSHFHFDHAANWDLFPRARIYLHAAEIAYLNDEAANCDSAILRHQLTALQRDTKLVVLNEDAAIGEDLRIVHVPGHTPSSVALVHGDHVFCGDALKNRWDLGRSDVSLPVFDPPQARRSIERLCALGGVLHPGHDAALARAGDTWTAVAEPTAHLHYPDGTTTTLRAPLGGDGHSTCCG